MLKVKASLESTQGEAAGGFTAQRRPAIKLNNLVEEDPGGDGFCAAKKRAPKFPPN
jgi:hypothetical protein